MRTRHVATDCIETPRLRAPERNQGHQDADRANEGETQRQ